MSGTSGVRSWRGAGTSRGESQDGPWSGVTFQVSATFPSPVWTPEGAQQLQQTAWVILWCWTDTTACSEPVLGHVTGSSTPVTLNSLKNKLWDILLLFFSLCILIHAQKILGKLTSMNNPRCNPALRCSRESGCRFRGKAQISFGVSDPVPKNWVSEWRGHLSCCKCKRVKTEKQEGQQTLDGNLGKVGLKGKGTRIKYRKINCEWKGEAEIEGVNWAAV